MKQRTLNGFYTFGGRIISILELKENDYISTQWGTVRVLSIAHDNENSDSMELHVVESGADDEDAFYFSAPIYC